MRLGERLWHASALQVAEFAPVHHDNGGSKIYISSSIRREVVLDAPQTLVIDLLSFLKAGPRPYHEVMDAWRTSCPRLPIWEDAVDLGLVEREHGFVVLTEAGRNLLALQS